jgi:hypothetical protein
MEPWRHRIWIPNGSSNASSASSSLRIPLMMTLVLKTTGTTTRMLLSRPTRACCGSGVPQGTAA